MLLVGQSLAQLSWADTALLIVLATANQGDNFMIKEMWSQSAGEMISGEMKMKGGLGRNEVEKARIGQALACKQVPA